MLKSIQFNPNMDCMFVKGASINHGQLRRGGQGVIQITILLHKPNLAKVTTKGEGVKMPKNLAILFMDDPWP